MDSARAIDTSAFAARLQKLERENRVLKRSALVVLLVLSAVVAMAQAPATRTVIADEFMLKDSTGVIRAKLGFARGEPRLTLLDAAGQPRAVLGTEFIDFMDSNSTTRVVLGSSSAGELSPAGQVLPFEGPSLYFSGADKRVMVDLRETPRGGTLYLRGRNEPNSGPSLELTDAQGFKTVVGSVSLTDPSTGTSSRTSAASITLFGKDGKSIWSAP